MLTLSGLKKFYFLPNFHDMRCKAPRVAEIVRNKYHRDPLNEMAKQLKEANDKVLKLTSELQTANECLGVLNSEHFGTSKSLKGSGKNKMTKGKNDGRDDMGGKASVNNSGSQPEPLA